MCEIQWQWRIGPGDHQPARARALARSPLFAYSFANSFVRFLAHHHYGTSTTAKTKHHITAWLLNPLSNERQKSAKRKPTQNRICSRKWLSVNTSRMYLMARKKRGKRTGEKASPNKQQQQQKERKQSADRIDICLDVKNTLKWQCDDIKTTSQTRAILMN